MNAEKRKYSDKLAVAANQNIDERDYWLEKLSGNPEKTHFPFDYNHHPRDREKIEDQVREFSKDTNRNRISFRFPGELFTKAMNLSSGVDLKFHIILAASLMALLERYTGHKDIMIGSPILKQDIKIDFVNTLLIFRNRVEKHMTFKQLLLEVRDTIIKATDHQNYPMVVLYDQLNLPVTGTESPFFDVALLLENLHDESYIKDIYCSMTFSFRLTDEYVQGKILYDPRRYHRDTIRRISSHFTRVLDATVSNVNMPLGEIDILSAEEKKQLLVEFNQASLSIEPVEAQLLHHTFEKQTMAVPDCAALIYGDYHITYRVLNEKSTQLANLLRQKGVTPDTIVGLWVPPSIEMMIGELGILKSGGAYLPIALDAPDQRVHFILEDSNTKMLLISGDFMQKKKMESWKGEIVFLSADLTNTPFESDGPKGQDVSTLAYVIYTSGTTGQPKGVMVEHNQVMAYLRAFYREFDIYPQDTVIQLAPYSFDVFIEEVYSLLLRGGKILMLTENEIMDIRQFSTLILKHQVSIIDCTPMLLSEFNKLNPRILRSVRLFISGADLLKEEHITNLSQIGTTYNTYGPTETTVCAAYYKYTKPLPTSIPIGKPITGYYIYILDDLQTLQPIGVAGEICISGPGVTRGYMNRPEITAKKFKRAVFCHSSLVISDSDKFFPNGQWSMTNDRSSQYTITPLTHHSNRSPHHPIPPLPHSPIYHTGDLGRWLPDGNIQFLGRNDQQVKIRGYRIELKEIETQLLNHHEIKECILITTPDQEGEKNLCAYIIPNKNITVSELREYLSKYLPYYMIPSYFVMLEKIPLTVNGKIDYHALPAPQHKRVKEYTAPRDNIEAQLVTIWTEVLGGETPVTQNYIGIDDDFFELGGHSLKATILVSRVHHTFHIELPPIELFQHPTIREIAKIIAAAEKKELKNLQKIEKKEYYESSFNQKRLMVIHRLEPESPAYNMIGNIEIMQPMDEEVIKKVLHRILNRHESLRTWFKTVNREPVLVIAKKIELPLQIIDLSALSEKEKLQKRKQVYTEEANKPFDLFHFPLFRTILLKIDHSQYEFIFNLHHIITDGWSMEILTKDISCLYREYMRKPSIDIELEPLPLQYKDFAAWHNKQLTDPIVREQSHQFWKAKLKQGIDTIKLPEIFGSHRENRKGAAYRCVLDKDIKEKLMQLAQDSKGTLFTVLFSIYLILLSRLSDQTRVTSSIISAGRKHFSLHHIVGFFINSILFNTRVDHSETFEDFLRRINREVQETFQHETYPLELVFKDLKMKYPEIPVSFNMLNIGAAIAEGELKSLTPDHQEETNDVKFDLEPYVEEYKNGIRMTWAYKKSVFKSSFIEYIVSEYLNLVDFFTTGKDKRLSSYGQKRKKRHFSRKNNLLI